MVASTVRLRAIPGAAIRPRPAVVSLRWRREAMFRSDAGLSAATPCLRNVPVLSFLGKRKVMLQASDVVLRLKRQRCSPRAAAWRWRPRQDGCDSPADARPGRTYHQSARGSRLAGSRVHPSPKCGPRTSSRPGVNCPFEAAVAGPVLRLAERKLERLVHEAGKPARQDAADVDAVEHGPAPVRPRLLAHRRA